MSKSIELRKTAQRKYNILLVDDDAYMLELSYEILKSEDYQVTTARSGEAALEALHTDNFDLVITDLNMDRVNGISVLKEAKELDPETIVIIMTGSVDVTFAIEALRLGADDYILKPFRLDGLLDRLSHCLKKLGIKRRDRQSVAYN